MRLVLFILLTCIQAQFQSGFIHDGTTVYCWHTRLGANGISEDGIISQAVGRNCPIQMNFIVTKDTVQVFEKIESEWTVAYALNNGNNGLGMDELTLGAVTGTSSVAEIPHSNVHSCQFGSNCNPFQDGVNGASPTSNQFSNLSRSADPWSARFTSGALQFETLGIYSLAAHIYLPGPDRTRYDFVVYKQITVQASDATAGANFIHDGKTTYCYHINEDFRVSSPAISSVLASGLGSECPIEMLTDGPGNVAPVESFTVNWVPKIRTESSQHKFSLPTPLQSNDQYEIVHSNVHGCFFGSKCSPFEKGTNPVDATSNQPGNFGDEKQHVYSSDELVLNQEAAYTMFAHIVLPGPDNTRYDFVTYFPVTVRKVAEPDNFKQDGTTTYCWISNESHTSTDLKANSIVSSGRNDACPVELSIKLSSRKVKSLESVKVSWEVRRSASSNGQIANFDTARAEIDPASNQYYTIWHSNVHSCEAGSNCSPFSPGLNPQTPTSNQVANFSSAGVAEFQANDVAFSEEGVYSVLAHVVIAMEGGERLDLSTFQTVTVDDSSSNGGISTGAVIGIVIGALLVTGILIAAIVVFRRSQRRLAHSSAAINSPYGDPEAPWTRYAASVGPASQSSEPSTHHVVSINGNLVEMDGGSSIKSSRDARTDTESINEKMTTSEIKWNTRTSASCASGPRETLSSVPVTSFDDDDWTSVSNDETPPPAQFEDSEYQM